MNKVFTLLLLISFHWTVAQNASTKIEMVSSNWEVPQDAKFERFDNIETLVLKSGRAEAKNQNVKNGTIEVDVYANSKRSFAGITFRKQNDDMEEVYMRMHKSNQVDAVQYTPIFNGESNWQLYREHQAKVPLKSEGWNSLRVEVVNKRAEVFVNDDKVMIIDNLRTDNEEGRIGLWALFENRFSNFRVTHKNDLMNINMPVKDTIDPAIITQWHITDAKPYRGQEFSYDRFLEEQYTLVKTENSGLLPISKYLKKTSKGNFEENEEDYTIAYTTVEANEQETRVFSFDYSDRIIVYLNGVPVFKGNNAFRAKGIQHTGHIEINTNKLYLPLQKGLNRIHCVVIDKANGWGLIAKLE